MPVERESGKEAFSGFFVRSTPGMFAPARLARVVLKI
jgi:hypothetical protein